jgi:hypothetical protein
MESLNEVFQKTHKGEFILVILMAIYLVMGFKTPTLIAHAVDNIVGKVVIIVIIIFLFINAHPILAVVAALVAFDLMRRSNDNTGLGALQSYAPSEQKKMSQFTAFNQFPYTLEQEVVAKMAPIVRSGSSLNTASYKPLIDNNYDATNLTNSN